MRGKNHSSIIIIERTKDLYISFLVLRPTALIHFFKTLRARTTQNNAEVLECPGRSRKLDHSGVYDVRESFLTSMR